MGEKQDQGASAVPTGLSQAEPAGLGPPGFDPSRGMAADFFAYFPKPSGPEELKRIVRETFAGWNELGSQQGRITLISGDAGEVGFGYPHGLWIEGWKRRGKTLAFGQAEYDGGPISPPLTYRDSDGSPKGGDACGSVHDSAGPEDIAQGKQP